jgi:hypothetical protein
MAEQLLALEEGFCFMYLLSVNEEDGFSGYFGYVFFK